MKSTASRASRQGFTLFETSLVLVIVGLLIGGVFAGRSLIAASEMRAVGDEYQQFVLAFGNFRDRYGAAPGDMKNAIDFWGDNAAYCSDGNAANNGRTCNGDGNGKLAESPASNKPGEMFLFWQHLALAGLIPGEFTGISGPGNPNDAVIDVNSPPSRYEDGGWTIRDHPPLGAPGEDYAINYGNHFTLGADNGPNDTDGKLLETAHALAIDSKYDEGRPATGKIVSTWWDDACSKAVDGTNSANDLNAVYAVDNAGRQCTLIFRDIF